MTETIKNCKLTLHIVRSYLRKESIMALFTKCILESPEPQDGIRISIMSRHTLSDGITPDARIQKFDIHMPILGPSPKLIGDYCKRGISWAEFETRYLNEIKQEPKCSLINYLACLAIKNDVTLLCIEETCEHCHRRLLAEACQLFIPKLLIKHR